LFGKPWKKDLCFSDVKLQTSSNQSNSIRVNDTFFAIPWETAGGGSLVVVPLSLQGPKIPAKYPILNAQPSPISDY
jgi:coronin-1B/1C/6